MKVLVALVLMAAALYLLNRLALWLEGLNLIYYRRRSRPPGVAADALLELEKTWNPPVEHVLELRRKAGLEGIETGESSGGGTGL